jgi:putative transposase
MILFFCPKLYHAWTNGKTWLDECLQEAGMSIKDLSREHGVSEATIYNWKAKYGGMEANEVKRMKDLEEENSRLKRIVANLTLEIDAVKNVLEKKYGGLTTNGK